MTSSRRYILTLSCPDRVGIVAAVSSLIAANNGWISEAQHHSEQVSERASERAGGRFFMRQEILSDSLPFGLGELRLRFLPIADRFDMSWAIRDSAQKNG